MLVVVVENFVFSISGLLKNMSLLRKSLGYQWKESMIKKKNWRKNGFKQISLAILNICSQDVSLAAKNSFTEHSKQ